MNNKEEGKYTQKEVQSNINILSSELEQEKLNRTALSKKITAIKKQIEYWEELDLSQYKIF